MYVHLRCDFFSIALIFISKVKVKPGTTAESKVVQERNRCNEKYTIKIK